MKKIFSKLILLALIGILGFSSLVALPVFAADDPCGSNVPESVRAANGCSGNNVDSLPNIIRGILVAIIAIVGIIAVIFIIVGGVQYITSSGEATKLQKARNTIIYAVIGLIICVFSFAIVNFTINSIINGQAQNSSSDSDSDSDSGSGSGSTQNRNRGQTQTPN